MERTHYDTLGVEPTATPEDVKKAYRRLARELHPDQGGDAEAFAAVNVAYGVLRDASARAAYDLTLSTPDGPNPVEEDWEPEVWGEEVDLDLETETPPAPAPAPSPRPVAVPRPAPAPTYAPAPQLFTWARTRTAVAVTLAVVALGAGLPLSASTGLPWIAYGALAVGGLTTHRAFLTNHIWVSGAVAVLLTVWVTVGGWRHGITPGLVATGATVPLLVAGELVRSMRRDR